ncbi:MAG TPA: T9SS type A sorting domain-containing protein [Bacteroidia bacterium]|nr:T9SS type A sorting domain-containing protein [Bacteroidia bacterium]
MKKSTLYFVLLNLFITGSLISGSCFAQSSGTTVTDKSVYKRGYVAPESQATKNTITKANAVSEIKIDYSGTTKPASCSKSMSGACEIPVTFSNLGLFIPDNDPTGLTNSQIVSGVPGTAMGTDVQLKRVCFNITHTWVGDLTVTLIGPGGTGVVLMDRPGFPASGFGCNGDNVDVCVGRGTGNSMENECNNAPAISGNWTAIDGDDLNKFNLTGIDPNGTWQLLVIDQALGDTGSVQNWSLVFDNGPIALWMAPDEVCQTSGVYDLSSNILGTTGGTFSGQGVTGNNFDPSGLNGPIDITYVVSNTISGCTDSSTITINVVTTPTVTFSANVTPGSLTVAYTNTTTTGGTYIWDFGDGDSSTTENPSHTYAVSGIYNVTLTVTNSCGSFSTSQPVTVQGCPDVVTDGSFENVSGGSTWTVSSTNFNTPICDISCGLGSGTGPHSGSFWAWFGGANGPAPGFFEEGVASQVMTIPVGTATLNFYLEQVVCDGPDDFLKIAIDQDTVFSTDGSSALCGQFGYSLQSVNIDTYADGMNHTLTFFSRTYSLNGGVSNFFVDDVEIVACPPIGFAENDLASHIGIKPNPANDYFELTFNNIELLNAQVTVTDITGRTVLSNRLNNIHNTFTSRVDISGLSNGLYLINIQSGNQSITRKLIVQ